MNKKNPPLNKLRHTGDNTRGDLFGDQEFFDCHSPVAIK